mgnify:FL=1
MHIPENYLSPETCAVMAILAAPVVIACTKRIKNKLSPQELPLLGVGAAVSFLLMMFNIPVPGGTSAHAVGGTLLAALLGPEAAVLSVASALLIQAVFFGDGGILALGANIFNMAVLMPLVGYGLYSLLKRALPNVVALAIGAYAGINAAAFMAAIEFGIQPMLFHDPAGLALYAPYPLSIAIPAMMIPHLTIAGLAEVIFTVGIYSFVHGKDTGTISIKNKVLYGIMGLLVVLCPLGLLTEATAWGEWGTDEIVDVAEGGSALGYVPQGMEQGFSWESPLADYAFPGMPDVTGYILSAVIGIALLVIVYRVIGKVAYAR